MSRIKQLLQLKKLGLSNRQIAKELKISVYSGVNVPSVAF